jgi:hypothetical protein
MKDGKSIFTCAAIMLFPKLNPMKSTSHQAVSGLVSVAMLLGLNLGFPDDIYVLGTDGNLWCEHGDFQHRDWVDGHVKAFYIIGDRTIGVLGTDGTLWKEFGDMHHREIMGAHVKSVPQAPANPQYQLAGTDLYRNLDEYVDGNVAAFEAKNFSIVYVLDSDGRLWRERGNHTNREPVDENVQEFHLATVRRSLE